MVNSDVCSSIHEAIDEAVDEVIIGAIDDEVYDAVYGAISETPIMVTNGAVHAVLESDVEVCSKT